MTVNITTLFRTFTFLMIALAACQQNSVSGGNSNTANNTVANLATLLGTDDTSNVTKSSGIKLFVPSYFNEDKFTNDPKNPGEWDKLINILQTGDVMIINPDSGPSTAMRPKFKAVTELAKTKGIIVLGYVHTLVDAGKENYNTRDPKKHIFPEIAKYKEYYGITDIFFDEFDTRPETDKTKLLAFYKSICDHVRNGPSKGRTTLNPGTIIDERFANITDWIVVFEDNYDAYMLTPQDQSKEEYKNYWKWTPKYHDKIVHLVHTAIEEDSMKLAAQKAKDINAAYVFVTNFPECAAWDYLPANSYWNAEVVGVRK